jgi:glycerophosphoryl diester phosphodiesterase
MNLVDEIPTPIVFAHRGASAYAPENTIAAFDLAYSVGAPALELDTMLSKDGIPVVIHDNTVDRTTTAAGRVNQFTAAELYALDAGSSFSKDYQGEPIPLLRDVLVRYKDKLLINIELKNYHAPLDDLPIRVVELVKEVQNLDSLLFSSFLPINLIRIRRMLPGARVALLLEDRLYWRVLSKRIFAWLSPDYIHPNINYINPAYLEKEHKHGRRVNVWTVNDPDQAKDFIEWGVDGLITNDPEKILRLISHKR